MAIMNTQYDFSLQDRVAVVTGGASGIGRAIAEAYIAKGARVVLIDLSDRVHEAAEGMGAKLALQMDVTNRDQIDNAVTQTLKQLGTVDILVNSAGIVSLETAIDFQEAEWDKTMNVNLKSLFLLSQAFGRVMLKNGFGRIVNLASQAGLVALDKHLAYCVSKAGVISMTKVMAQEWSPQGVTVNAISPTVVLTELGKKAWAGEVGEQMKLKIPARRFAEPEEIAAAAVYLASDYAGIVTGENLVIDGGYTAQ